MDGVGGCLKNFVYRAVLSSKVVINSPAEFAAYAQNIKGITCLYMPAAEMLEEPCDVENTRYIPAMRTLQVHMVRRIVTKAGFCCLQFFEVASDISPYYSHWYNREGDNSVPCGHFDMDEIFDRQTTCAGCELKETALCVISGIITNAMKCKLKT